MKFKKEIASILTVFILIFLGSIFIGRMDFAVAFCSALGGVAGLIMVKEWQEKKDREKDE